MSERINGEELFTMTEVAQRLHVARQTVSAYVHSGRLGAVKIGRQWFFRKKDLQDFMNARSNWNATHTGGRPIGTTKLAKAQRLVDAKACVNECKIAGFVDKTDIRSYKQFCNIEGVEFDIMDVSMDEYSKTGEYNWCARNIYIRTKHTEAWVAYLKAPIRQKIAVIGNSNDHFINATELQTSTMTWHKDIDEEPPATLKDATEKDASPDS